MTLKDVYNIKQQDLLRDGDHNQLEQLSAFFTHHSYVVRYSHDEGSKRLKGVFSAHPRGIERARLFPEVFLLDATYKSNLNKLPLVNVIGINNLNVINYEICILILLSFQMKPLFRINGYWKWIKRMCGLPVLVHLLNYLYQTIIRRSVVHKPKFIRMSRELYVHMAYLRTLRV